MTEPRKDKAEPAEFESAEEYVEDLEAPASQQENVAGGVWCKETICSIEGETTLVLG
jgi:hypothetical protein